MSKRTDENRLRFKSVHLDMMVMACSNDCVSDLLSTVSQSHVMQMNDPLIDGAPFVAETATSTTGGSMRGGGGGLEASSGRSGSREGLSLNLRPMG